MIASVLEALAGQEALLADIRGILVMLLFLVFVNTVIVLFKK